MNFLRKISFALGLVVVGKKLTFYLPIITGSLYVH